MAVRADETPLREGDLLRDSGRNSYRVAFVCNNTREVYVIRATDVLPTEKSQGEIVKS